MGRYWRNAHACLYLQPKFDESDIGKAFFTLCNPAPRRRRSLILPRQTDLCAAVTEKDKEDTVLEEDQPY